MSPVSNFAVCPEGEGEWVLEGAHGVEQLPFDTPPWPWRCYATWLTAHHFDVLL